MRMWMLHPKMLCRKHLLGEHGEIHKHRHNFVKQHRITGRIYPIVLIEPSSMEDRHNILALEFKRRGYNHESPYTLPDLRHLPEAERKAKANRLYNAVDLSKRCSACEKKIKRYWRKYGHN